ncbi:uncharacterized protein LOC122661668 isoform X2 [Telopea speciosissima]|uniref:uncharacterized protein LOC122661668 isoform X2 n=1 Tax=Telopea speciosissima TaxID=54955 RepID=UPI001CC56907|nr:uncharacterized protein LOC122661668 isoform X2 [Telopea speciosissima]XP_043713082.1 uncharacterized protein LOC122661668 isoform X2 [Telopea speciosissima]
MKLRDRQDKVERMLSFYRSSKGNPFQEASTRVKGEVDVVGALLLVDYIYRQTCGTLDRAGVRTGTVSRWQSLTDFSFGPPLLNQYHDAAAALLVKRSKVAACLAEFVSGLGMQPDSTGIRHCLSTFGQVIYQLSKGTKLTLLGIQKMPKSLNQQIGLGFLTLPVGSLRRHKHPDTPTEASFSSVTSNVEDNVAIRSIGLMLELELDESTRIRGWVEMQKSSPRY